MSVIPFKAAKIPAKDMAINTLLGPMRLAYDEIMESVPRAMPGVFVLGHRGPGDRFYVDFIGRSDLDLREKLLSLIGSGNLFKFRSLLNGEAAFQMECDLFHDFKPPGNRVHPDRPAGTSWECPRCRFYRLPGPSST